ncbi:hypothetical protein FHG71_21155 [Rubellimicrobium roseum]|uniref:Uncharacterized protein n=1 Tax=Rubellimicrobium roseum TaxID=687525 RepID=A0A5C4NA09_9RHOB|nr:hypothetical protein FHG71_21155 [Rubellimicrobium roseum]
MAHWKEREVQRRARAHVPCGAQTRKGHSCRLLSEPGQRRCKFHGGRSAGPRTPEGRERIAVAGPLGGASRFHKLGQAILPRN